VTSGEFDAALAKQATNLAALLDSLPKNNSVESSGSET
jgi:hypothetical protein